MRKSQRAIILVFCALFAIFAFAPTAAAQQIPPSYGFLEIVDYKNEPVADASVRYSFDIYEEPRINQGALLEKTNQKGLLEKGIPVRYTSLESFFSVEKTGFYTFTDYFGLFGFLDQGWRNNKDNPVKIELLVIPKNSAEKKAIGNEQLKREFFGAARRGDTAAVRKFIKSGLSPNLTTFALRGIPAAKDIPIIIFAARSGNGETVREFLSAGVNVRKKDESISDILEVYLNAYPYRLIYAETEAGKIESLNIYENGADSLIEAGAAVDSGVLMIAVSKGYARTVKTLLSKGVPINAQDSVGRTYLHTAVEYGQAEIIDLLLKKGANPNLLSGNSDERYDYYCATPLMSAVGRDDVKLIKLLLAYKADPNLTCKNGQNALRIAMVNRKYEIFDMLVEAGADVKAVDDNGETNLMYAAGKGDAAAVKKMIEMGVPVNARSKQGSTALMIAASGGAMYSRLEKVKLLLKAGADPNIVNDQKYGNNNQFQRCETALINVAADADVDYAENTPLSIIDLLVASNADVNFTCPDGQNALLRAVYNGQVKGVRKLLDAGADVKGEKGRAALEQARKAYVSDYNRSRIEEIIKMLEAVVEK